MDHPVPLRRVERVRHELRRRDLEVARVQRLSPGFSGVTFGGAGLDGFVSASFDDHVKFMFGEGEEQVRRDYTPRRYDAARRELTIEFALHGHGAASEWARHVQPGQRAVIGGPRGSMIIPVDYDWHLLAGDATALPAVHRRLEELPPGSRALVVLQLEDADRRPIDTRAQVELHWVSSQDELVSAIRALRLPPGEGFAWCAGEAAVMARLRKILRDEKNIPREAMRVAAYWKQGASSHHENLED